jgi:3-deoxy-D-manno-octulosonic acid kinase
MLYRADLITQRIENSESLAARLLEGPLSLTQWIAVGRCIRRFHDAGVHHADLNAHNILLTPEQVYLIDFDRGTLRKRGWWADTTLGVDLGVADASTDEVYAAMDLLLARQDR